MSRCRILLFFVAVLCLLPLSHAAEPNTCELASLPPATASNMFNPEQEIALGDLQAARIESELSTMDDPQLTAYLNTIGERLVRHLPATQLRYRFYLSNEPEANAFAISGGRVYVTRKLIMNAHTEDELAGVIGHELGHIVTHQLAQEYTSYFKQLGMFTIGDRRDLEEKFHRFLEQRKQLRGADKGEDAQQVADRIGMEAVVRAGYRADAYSDFFDRIFENKGKKGSWWSDITGNTSPNSKRYREMVKLLPKLPSGCVEARPAGAEEAFHNWQKKVGGVPRHGAGRGFARGDAEAGAGAAVTG
jgi:predicted Zn-dependent protease